MQHAAEERECPQEIWLYIFRLATSITQGHPQITKYTPFGPVRRTTAERKKRLFDTKRAIVLVCKAWRVLAMEIMFEEIRIRHGTQGLLEGLERSGKELGVDGYARWVRRIVIDPVIIDFDVNNPVGIPPILARCTSAEMIIRPITAFTENPPLCRSQAADFPILSTLQRVDWWLASAGPNRHNNPWSSDFLSQILQNSPNLRYLTIAGNRVSQFFNFYNESEHPSHTLRLPSLQTLRVDFDSKEPLFAHTTFDCPKLNCFIIGASLYVCQPLLNACGAQLKVVEISKRCYSLFELEDTRALVKPVLDHCPNLEKLYIYIDTPLLPAANPTPIAHPKLEYVGLRAVGAPIFWGFVDLYPELFQGFAFPALKCVGVDPTEWATFNTPLIERIPILEESLRRWGCDLEFITSSGRSGHYQKTQIPLKDSRLVGRFGESVTFVNFSV